MKKLLFITFLFVSISLGLIAQITSGQVSYKMTFSSDDPSMAMVKQMMEGSKMILSFAPGKSHAEINMGMMGVMSTIVNSEESKVIMLMNMMGMKYAVEAENEVKEVDKNSKVKVEITSEKKTICGYECVKALVTDEEGKIITIWYTEAIHAQTEGQKYFNDGMPGFPLAMQISDSGLTIDFTALEVLTQIDQKIFNLEIPEGYELKTMEEFKKMGGQ